MSSYNPNEFSVPQHSQGGGPHYNPDVDMNMNGGEVGGEVAPDDFTVSEIVNGVLSAAQKGSTQLPSRDIPMDTEPYLYQNVQPNHIPEPTNYHGPTNYIEMDDARHDLGSVYRATQHKEYMQDVYDQFRVPLLLALLYYAFQLPFLKDLVGKYMPWLISTATGGYTTYGTIWVSMVFGIVYYTLTYIVDVLCLF